MNAAIPDQKAARAAAVQIVPPTLVPHTDRAVTATANVVRNASDQKRVLRADQNEVTETKHAAQVVAARKHHQNPVALVEAQTRAAAMLARIAVIAKRDRKLVKTVQVADDPV